MTREKQIKQAALERNCDGDFNSNDGLNGFVEGAQWADEHPKNPWISVKDRLPEKGDSIVVSLIYRGDRQYWVVENATYSLCNGKLYYGYYECDYWKHIDLIDE